LQTKTKNISTNKIRKQAQKDEEKYLDMALCVQSMESRSLAERKISDVHPGEEYVAVLCKLFAEVRKNDCEEYEPDSLAVA